MNTAPSLSGKGTPQGVSLFFAVQKLQLADFCILYYFLHYHSIFIYPVYMEIILIYSYVNKSHFMIQRNSAYIIGNYFQLYNSDLHLLCLLNNSVYHFCSYSPIPVLLFYRDREFGPVTNSCCIISIQFCSRNNLLVIKSYQNDTVLRILTHSQFPFYAFDRNSKFIFSVQQIIRFSAYLIQI